MKKRRHGCEKNKVIYIYIYISLFCVALLLPILSINTVQGETSDTELRLLASFPQIFDEGGIADGLKDGFESWLNDNIGFRSKMVELTANIKLNLFCQSTSDSVEIGRDGWYFYALDHNIELATGEYVLSGEMLQQIAAAQQQVSDWYKCQGITYILALTPAKTSVYPEYIVTGEYGIRETLCDQLEAYLHEHTDVQVVNPKPNIIAEKENHLMYRKTDTHWTEAGAYVAYQSILDRMEKIGFQVQPVQVTYGQTVMTGEMSEHLGCKGILDDETVPTILWEERAKNVSGGKLYEEIKTVPADNPANPQTFFLYENQKAENGTLLIYGDSGWEPVRKLPQLFAENFRTVVTMRYNRSPNLQLDGFVKPDVIVMAYGERLLEGLTKRGQVPEFRLTDLPELPVTGMISAEEYGQWIGINGTHIDQCDGHKPDAHSTELEIDLDEQTVSISGWAPDFSQGGPLKALYLMVGETVLECDYGAEKKWVAETYNNDRMLKSGFQVTFPASLLKDGEVKEISFIGESADGQHLYTPVTYQIIRK